MKPAEEPFKTTETRERRIITLVFFSCILYAYLFSNFLRDMKFYSERVLKYIRKQFVNQRKAVIIATVL